jgi:hypothetical protein
VPLSITRPADPVSGQHCVTRHCCLADGDAQTLWGGELPEFDAMDAVDELLNGLVAGLWNCLTAHQKQP